MVASRALVLPKWTCASSGGCGQREWASWGVWVQKGGVKVGTVRRGRGGHTCPAVATSLASVLSSQLCEDHFPLLSQFQRMCLEMSLAFC